MKSLCADDTQRAHIDQLISLLSTRELNGREAWSAFSSPERSKSFKRRENTVHRVTFTPAQIATYKTIREAAQKKLFQKCSGLCSYCRRPVGHYGWAWHIEHVLPKSKYPTHAFDLANLTVGCVHCNQWKGARIDKHVVNKDLPIINPVESTFRYSDHLHYVQVSTESFTFAKYTTHSPKGLKTYQALKFSELERAQTINGLHSLTASLHERLTRVMGEGLSDEQGCELVKLLAELKSSIYR
ncbi:HNH endonuclease [Pectobacterium odoriferum]|uniref:HNH endonuclease n=1 Tax=Pectobacterium odoriferum TaxID=78398 RepID=UPI000CD141FB|nr:HNH endonuclease [Pectobacterium odoriferum]POE04425.1 hypothetical protein BV916_10650 [Pectobacterium odoriferum]